MILHLSGGCHDRRLGDDLKGKFPGVFPIGPACRENPISSEAYTFSLKPPTSSKPSRRQYMKQPAANPNRTASRFHT